MSLKFKITPRCRPAHNRPRSAECRCDQADFELTRRRQLSPEPLRAMPACRSQRPETLLTSQRPRTAANQAAISDERPKPLRDHRNSASALSLPREAGSGRTLRAAQGVQEVEKWSGTRPDPIRGRSPAGRRVPASRRGPVWRWHPADRGYPARRRVAVVPARAPFRVMPVAGVWPARPVGSPVGRETTRWFSGNCR